MSRSFESSVTSIPSEAIQKVFISSYEDIVEDITDLVHGFSIYEHLMKPTSIDCRCKRFTSTTSYNR